MPLSQVSQPIPLAIAVALFTATLAGLLARTRARRRREVLRRAVGALADVRDGVLAARVITAAPAELLGLTETLNEAISATQARVEAQERLARSNRVLMNAIAHDLRTPITSIAGYVQAVQQGIAPDPALALAVVARKTAEVSALVDNLFYLTRFRLGDVTLATQSVDVAEAVRLSLLSFLPRIEASGITVETKLSDHDCLAQADPTALTRILDNLIRNSLDHAQGMTRLTVATSHPEENEWVEIHIADNGPGIAPAIMAELQRETLLGKEIGPASGYGLAIARALARQMGGRLTARSDAFEETRFTLRLPAI